MAVSAATGERIDDARLLHLRGELRLASGDGPGGEADLRAACDAARAMGAVAWEAAATHALAGLVVGDAWVARSARARTGATPAAAPGAPPATDANGRRATSR